MSIGDLANTIAQLMGRPIRLVREPERLRPGSSEVMRLLSDSSELRARTGWAPTVSLEDGLRATVEWFTAPGNLARYPSTQYTI